MHEETMEGSDNAMTLLSKLEHDGEPVKANQFMFKAILLDTTLMMMQDAVSMSPRIQMQLS